MDGEAGRCLPPIRNRVVPLGMAFN
jgi:hypothetical protein